MKSKLLFILSFIFSLGNAQVKYVTVNGAGLKDGSSWANAYDNFSFAGHLWNADPNTVFWLAKGLYKPQVNSSGDPNPVDTRLKTFAFNSAVKIFGGFAGTETSLSQRNILENPVILSGDINVPGDSTDNSYHVTRFYNLSDITVNNYGIDGCTISDGNADGTGDNAYGGAVYTIQDAKFLNCTFLNNTAKFGGAIYNHGSGGYIGYCKFIKNTAVENGGAFLEDKAYPAASETYDCLFYNNKATRGGAIYLTESFNANPYFVSCTFYANYASNNGGAIYLDASVGLILDASILWNDISNGDNEIFFNSESGHLVESCDIAGGYTGNGQNNIAEDPLFVNALNGDFHLLPCSPAVNSVIFGFDASYTDLDGNPRVDPFSMYYPDMGAYEYQGYAGDIYIADSGTVVTKNVLDDVTVFSVDTTCKALGALEPNGSNPLNGTVTFKTIVDSVVENYNGQYYVRRHYDIQPSSNSSNAAARVTLYFLQSDFDSYNAVSSIKLPANASDAQGISNLKVTQFHGEGTAPGNYTGNAVLIDPPDQDIVWNSKANHWEISFNVTGFSGFYIHTGSVALPLRLLNFTATSVNGNNKLAWLVAGVGELNQFVIQRSTNGSLFNSIGQLSYNNKQQEYQFIDSSVNSTSYYRIKMIDADGKINYSEIVSVIKTNVFAISKIYPNPVLSVLSISFSGSVINGKKAILTLIDISEREFLKKNIMSSETISIDMNRYSPGIYFITLNSETGKQIFKVIKN